MVSDGGQRLDVVNPSYGKVQCRQLLGKRSMMSGFRSTMNLRKVGKRDRIFCSLSIPLPADLPLGLFHLPSLVLSSTKNGAFGCFLILYTFVGLGACLCLGHLAALRFLSRPKFVSSESRRHSHNSLSVATPSSIVQYHQHIRDHTLRPSDIQICCPNAKNIGLRGLLPHYLLNQPTT